MNAQTYLDRLPLLLLQYQFVEEGLKMYIIAIEHVIRHRLKGLAHYEVDEKEIWGKPLGTLIREFKKRSDRKDIVLALQALVEDRNFFAHRGYLLTFEEQNGQSDISDLLKRFEDALVKARKCVTEVLVEGARVRGEKIPEETLKQMA